MRPRVRLPTLAVLAPSICVVLLGSSRALAGDVPLALKQCDVTADVSPATRAAEWSQKPPGSAGETFRWTNERPRMEERNTMLHEHAGTTRRRGAPRNAG